MWQNEKFASTFSETGWFKRYFLPVFVFGSAALLYRINLDRFPSHDELYHVLAARSYLETGEMRIAQGIYERNSAYTWLVAQLFGWFGDSLAVARLPSVVSMAAVSALLFAWLQRVVNTNAALIGGILFAISPFAVDTALFIRFYAVQSLAFFIGAIFIYAAVERAGKKRYLYLALAIPPMLAAAYFQKTTFIGLAGVGGWVALRYAGHFMKLNRAEKQKQGKVVLVLAGIAAITLILLIQTGTVADMLATYNHTSQFSQSRAGEYWFYVVRYLKLYPTLWPAIGLITLFALSYRTKPAFFAAVTFAVCLISNSFAAAKGMRYIIYAQPFFFILLGIGLVPLVSTLASWLQDYRLKVTANLPIFRGAATTTAIATIVAALLILVVGNPALIRTVALLGNFTVPPERPKVDWMAAHEELKPWLEKADVVVTMTELEMLYHYGHYDLLFSASRLGEIRTGEIRTGVDFDADPRTGKPIIASTVAISNVLGCYRTGIFIANKIRWRHPDYISESDADLITAKTQPLSVPARSQVIAFTWELEGSPMTQEACADLPRFREDIMRHSEHGQQVPESS